MRQYFVYMLRCADDSFYVGITNDIERRLWEHNQGISQTSYTFKRRPVVLAHSSCFPDVNEAIAWEKHLKGWSRAKKRALAQSDWQTIHEVVQGERKRREARLTPFNYAGIAGSALGDS